MVYETLKVPDKRVNKTYSTVEILNIQADVDPDLYFFYPYIRIRISSICILQPK